MYCSLDEAFQSNVNSEPQSALQQQQPKRSGKRSSKRPPTPVPEPFVVDPDRPANKPMPPSEHVGGGGTKYQGMLNALENDESFFPHPNSDQQGADGAYQLEPDWAAQFRGAEVPPWIKERLAAKDAEVPLKPAVAPWMDAQPTLWQKIPAAYAGSNEKAPVDGLTESRIAALEARLEERIERMFAKLEDLDRGRSESNHMEVILFILGGFFLLLMLDMLVKQGLRASVMLAAAGGGRVAMQGGAVQTLLKHMIR